MSGEYKEKLPNFNEGNLIVRSKSWYIQFYFSGPDLRYNGTFFRIEGSQVKSYISAYKNNWGTYLKLSEVAKATKGELTKSGELNMTIRAGNQWSNGVCITSYHMPIKSRPDLDNIIKDLEWAEVRANEIMKLLQSIEL